MELEGKVALVTGASSGIGAATAHRLAREGCDVALLARGRPGLEVVAERVRREGRRALVLPCDVTDRDGIAGAVARVEEELGGLDLLVSNAAAVVFGRFEHVSPEAFDRTMEITFGGAVNVIRACLPALAARHGAIVAVGSIMTKIPLPTFSSYAAAKHALRGFLSSLRIELHAAGDPVRISLVNPGSVDTPLWDSTTTATGKRPHRPPDSYDPDVLARAVVDCAKHPRDELTVGGEARALELLYATSRPVAERVLGIAHRLYASGRIPADGPGGLWEASGTGDVRGTPEMAPPFGFLHGRPSLWTPVRLAMGRLRPR
ncbi:SDR family oxidoreductase [Conexibacter sp. SYSU D00693]|uniref:SDR family NAD(P)-dependent oxidoreductase n=1 Tax=Conexibacter sp. SYSU D00693 TaxID=2812560 RepID=UPI00196ABBDD|nr:SDR family NAD(P)-dependent oxidoreductase [Conexibacter sp. SYSU D00693]